MESVRDMDALKSALTELLELVETEIQPCLQLGDLENLRVRFLGRKSEITQLFSGLLEYPAEQKKPAGKLLNEARSQIEKRLTRKKMHLDAVAFERKTGAEAIDASLPGDPGHAACLHPITASLNRIQSYFARLGFDIIQGPEIETRYYNFHALNVPITHPACSKQDTFWLGPNYLLRTHTSGVQIRALEQLSPPFRILSPGRVYRRDSDQTHTPMFHQIEGMWLQPGLSLSALKALLTDFIQFFFSDTQIEVRFRPSFFPFTVPSAEMDIRLRRKSVTPWMEVLGCGVVHPQLLHNANLDPSEWAGLAFGLGVERLAMLRYGIEDLRTLYEHDVAFLSQFLQIVA